jgi:RNA polymerase sigma-70 factor (ECF subfamily)
MSIAAEILEADRRMLWGVCYRMTGSAADADDLVQETFVRAMENPPPKKDQPLRPWLVRVAINLSRDLLRHRRRRNYTGPWLPSPVPTDEAQRSVELAAPQSDSPSSRVSFAFLRALEALTPAQRAVLLLRDVLDYSTAETASSLGISEANVKVHLHRARRRMRDYDKERFTPNPALDQRTRAAIERFLACLSSGDIAALEKLLTEDVVSLSDGGGEVYAALNPVRGRAKVARLVAGLAGKLKRSPEFAFCHINGLPALVIENPDPPPNFASRLVAHFEVDSEGMIRRLGVVLAPGKLTAIKRLGYSNADK